MLILSRRIGESICVGDDVQITVLGSKKGQVRLGVQASKEIPVHREEVYKRIKNERREKFKRDGTLG
jgi:carbon storage regulator